MFQDFVDGLRYLVRGVGGATPEEKRELVRLRCHYRVTCVTPRRALTGTVVDMSLRGMRLDLPEKLGKGVEVKVTYAAASGDFPLDTVRCEVAWSRRRRSGRYFVGVRYTDTRENMARSWVKYILRQLGFDEETIFQRRRAVRVMATLRGRVTLRRAGGAPREVDGRVLNLGVGGALFQADDEVPGGASVTVAIGPYGKLPTLSLPAVVRTVRFEAQYRSWLHGLKFVDPERGDLDLLGKYVIGLLREEAASAS